MFFAINSNTNEKVNSLTIENNPSYNFIDEDIWFADPDEIESCPKEIDIIKIKVRFRTGKIDVINWNGTKYDISPHFFIPNKTKLGINVIPESKEHKLAKNWIYNKIKKEKLILRYSSVTKPYKYFNEINLFDLPIDKEKIGIEVTSSTINSIRRADVICPFIVKHPILGNGIVFEIQFSNQKQKTKVSRELDWAIRGYSIAWLFKEDFNQISDLIIDLKEEGVKVDSFANLIKQNNKSFVRELKFTVQEECRKLDEKKNEIIESIQDQKIKTLNVSKEELYSWIDNHFVKLKSNLQPICPFCNIKAKLISWNNKKFWGCSNHPKCSWSSSY